MDQRHWGKLLEDPRVIGNLFFVALVVGVKVIEGMTRIYKKFDNWRVRRANRRYQLEEAPKANKPRYVWD